MTILSINVMKVFLQQWDLRKALLAPAKNELAYGTF